MNEAVNQLVVSGRGIQIRGTTGAAVEAVGRSFLNRLRELGIDHHVQMAADTSAAASPVVEFRLRRESADELAPGNDTTQLCSKLNLDTQRNPSDLEREILLTMMLCPIPFLFPSLDELMSAIRIRQNIVEAARKTALAFATAGAERPEDYWGYSRDRGFVVLPGRPLIEALRQATQPDRSGVLYSFSCYRATEYVIALAVAQEAMCCNPELFAKLQRQAEIRAIKSGEFHKVFCREYGTRADPLPLRYFVPGDRTWFRNPDSHSSDASGYEGSWVFYLGDCQFTNFWKRDKPFSFTTKCMEMFHWRHATFLDDEGELRIDESVVDAHVEATLTNPAEVEQILRRMERIYDPAGVYAEGGCIDYSREYPRLVCPGTTDIVLPDAE